MTDALLDWRDPDYTGIIERRIELLKKLRADPEKLGGLLKYYASDPYRVVDFVNDWAWTIDPRRLPKPTLVPFVLFPKQRDYLVWLTDRYVKKEHGVVEKSRDMGVTWLAVWFCIYHWRFFEGFSAGFGSRIEDLVDRVGDPDSIFEKIRIGLRNLPLEILPNGYDEKSWAKFENVVNLSQANRSSIKGQAGDDIGRGGRSTIFFLDEAASIERPESVEAALSANTEVRIDQSTPRGPGNPFYRKRHSGNFPVFTFHWKDDPRKGDAWYARKTKELDPVILAQEVDIDYHASIENIVIEARWVRASRDLRAKLDLPYFRCGVAGLDVAAGGAGRSVFVARFGPLVDTPVAWREGDTTATADHAMDLAWDAGVDHLSFDTIGVGQGVASTLKRRKRQRLGPAPGGGTLVGYILVHAVNAGSPAPDSVIWEDGQTSQAKFANLKAHMWWVMRTAFQATYEYWLFTQGNPAGRPHPIDELILLPEDEDLATQLSAPTWNRLNSGKIAIESKERLRARGIASPDHAEALSLTFAPVGTGFATGDLAGMY